MTNLQYPIFKAEQLRTYSHFWEHDQIQEMAFRHEIGVKPSFRFCFGKQGVNLSRALIKDINKRTTGKIPLSLVIQIVGMQGSGKSKLSFQIAKLISGKRFTAEHIFMEREKLLEAVKKAKANDTYILDEQTLEFGEGSQRQLAEIQNIQEVTRIKQIHFIYNSPTTRTHLSAHYSFRVIQKNIQHRITKFAFCSNDFSHYLGFGLAKIPEDSTDKLYLAYEPVKLAYVEKILKRETEKYNLGDKLKQIENHELYGFVRSKQELIVITSELFPTMTTGEHKTLANAVFLNFRRKNAKRRAEELIKTHSKVV